MEVFPHDPRISQIQSILADGLRGPDKLAKIAQIVGYQSQNRAVIEGAVPMLEGPEIEQEEGNVK